VIARSNGEVDRVHIVLLDRVGYWSFAVWALTTLGMIGIDHRAAAGVGLGGALSLGLLGLHAALLKAWMRSLRRRVVRIGLWAIWLVKWPALGGLLYWALSGGWVTPLWLCVGVGLVPAVTTGLVVWSLVADGWRNRSWAGAKW
jgi:hypothetical protein